MADVEPQRLTRAREDQGDLVTHLYNRRAFWGHESVLYRRSHPMEWARIEGNYQNWEVDTGGMAPTDAVRADGGPLELFANPDVRMWLSKRHESMPFFCRNGDADELHIISRGSYTYETDFGTIEAGERDLLLIPKGVAYRASVGAPGDTLRLIVESKPEIFVVPTEMVDHIYHKGRQPIALDRLKYPVLGGPAASGPVTMRIKYSGAFSDVMGETSTIVYDRYPFDTEIIDGVNSVFKFSVTDIEKLGTTPVPFVGAAYMDNPKNVSWTFHLSGGGERAPVHRDPDVDECRYISSGPKMGSILFSPHGVDHGAGRGYTKQERNRPQGPYDTGDTLSLYTIKPLKGTRVAFEIAKPILC
ncbi:MAG TPA: hypothetical protein VGK54_11900 [Chloroflexota bacterium]